MLYKITNISNTNLILEPPTVLRSGNHITREYPPGIIPKRMTVYQKQGMIEICPVSSSSKVRKKLVVVNKTESLDIYVEVPRVYTSAKAVLPDLKNYNKVPFIESNKIEFVDITGLFK